GHEFDGARVIKGGKRLKEIAIDPKGRRHIAQPAAGVDVGAKVGKQILRRAIAHVDVYRRFLSRHSAIAEPRKRVERIELIALSGLERATKVRIEEILLANRDRKRLVRLRGQRRFLSPRSLRGFLAHVLSRASHKEAIRDAVFNLVRVGDRINQIKTKQAIKVVDAGDAAIDDKRLDHVTKQDRAITA